jgi:hypothetical protein
MMPSASAGIKGVGNLNRQFQTSHRAAEACQNHATATEFLDDAIVRNGLASYR